jgi:hypothetical protein
LECGGLTPLFLFRWKPLNYHGKRIGLTHRPTMVERTAAPPMVKTICGFKIDKLRIADDY